MFNVEVVKKKMKSDVYLANLKGHSLSLFLLLFFFIHLLIVAEDVLRDLLRCSLSIAGLLWGGSSSLFLSQLGDLLEGDICYTPYWASSGLFQS